MFTRNSIVLSNNIKTPLTAISRAIGNILQLTYGQLVKQLFSNQEQGFAYDPNDLSTLYQDAVGNYPVTAAGQPVGLMLDKSKGLVLGGGRLVNGDFSNGSANWAVSNADATHVVTFADGKVRYQSDTATPVLTLAQGGALVTGRWYEVTVNCSSYVSGSLKIDAGNGAVVVVSGLGTFKTKVLASTSTLVLVRNVVNTDITIESISVKEIHGNHAYQSVSASRPILQQTPILGNELVVNGSFSAGLTGWTNPDSGGAVTSASGGTVKLNANGGAARLRQSVNITSAGTYLVEVDAVAVTGGTTQFGIGNTTSGDLAYGVFSVAEKKRYSLVIQNVAVGLLGLALITNNTTSYTELDNITVKKIEGYRTDQNYLAFDGADDFLQTNNIDFTATDKVSLFAGVKHFGATTSMLVELSSNSSLTENIRAFYLTAPEDTTRFAFRARTKVDVGQLAYSPSLEVGSKNIIRAVADLSVPISVFSVNGKLSNINNSSALGTGNFGNYPLYIGRRGGTSLPFNGHLYSLIGIGRLTTDSETIALEKSIAKNTGVTLNV